MRHVGGLQARHRPRHQFAQCRGKVKGLRPIYDRSRSLFDQGAVTRKIVSRRELRERSLQVFHFWPQPQMVHSKQYVRMQRAYEEATVYLIAVASRDHFSCSRQHRRRYLPAAPEQPGMQHEIENVPYAEMVRGERDRRKTVVR